MNSVLHCIVLLTILLCDHSNQDWPDNDHNWPPPPPDWPPPPPPDWPHNPPPNWPPPPPPDWPHNPPPNEPHPPPSSEKDTSVAGGVIVGLIGLCCCIVCCVGLIFLCSQGNQRGGYYGGRGGYPVMGGAAYPTISGGVGQPGVASHVGQPAAASHSPPPIQDQARSMSTRPTPEAQLPPPAGCAMPPPSFQPENTLPYPLA